VVLVVPSGGEEPLQEKVRIQVNTEARCSWAFQPL
jgi:hypothetical protein